MIVWISGPTGAGKSSLARVLSAALGYGLIQENLPKELFSAFASDPVRHCALLQEEIMHSRFKGWLTISNSSRLVFDRSIDEDAHVFCRMHRESGLLNDQQYERLQTLSRKLQDTMPRPDLIIFMCPQRSALAERVRQTHPSTIVQNLDRQVSLYTEWLSTRNEDIFRWDNSGCSLQTVQTLFSKDPQC